MVHLLAGELKPKHGLSYNQAAVASLRVFLAALKLLLVRVRVYEP